MVTNHYVPGKRSEVVYQGVDPGELRPEGGFDSVHPSVAIVQNHSILPKVQGLLNFREVVNRLPKVHFYVAEGEAWAQNFLPLVKEHYARLHNVHFVKGITTSGAVSRLLTACDCYVLASGLDCCPTTVLEASLLEKPVLASRVGGVPEIIVDGYTGWSIDNNRIDEWVGKIEMLLADTKLARTLGTQGRKWVSEKFGWNSIASQVERLIINEVERKL
jgi:glycosyltransferase involved in cell wall biosynthesis